MAPRVDGVQRGSVQARGSALLIGAGVLMVCLAIPATLVGAQAPAPAADPVVVPPEPAEAPAPPQPPEAPGPSTDPPAPTPAPDEPAPPAPAPVDDSATTVSAARSTSVAIQDGNQASAFVFSPSSVAIATGDTVTWTNQGSAPEGHDVTGDGLASGVLQQGQSYSHTFTSAGTVNYICSLHPFMKGSVTVAAGGGGGGGSGDDPSSAQDPSAASAPGSESAAVTTPGAAGSDSQLPSTGMPVWPLLATGVGFLLGGAMLRRRALSGSAS
jgi:plastocyanin